MLSMSAPSPGIARSSLEEMLDSIRQRDERPKDVPPALPTRPVSRGRLPSSRRSLPVNFKIGSDPLKQLPNGSLGKPEGKVEQSKPVQEKKETTKDKETEFRSGIFGSKRMKIERPEESPYATLPEPSESTKEKLEEVDDSVSTASLSSSALPSSADFVWDGTADYVLKKKLRVWCLIPSAKWQLGKIQSICEEDATVLISDGKILKVCTENLLPANPDILEGVDNLIQLSFLNEPSVLHNLEYRYSQDVIYTKAGPVLVAVNPFKELSLYGNDFIAAYKQKQYDSPHVYEIADNAFTEMMRHDINQSIIISGESGAGKTETAKVAMQYLASLGGGNGIEYEVLRTNIVLESFGNAKTLKNDNSSRFGKLTEIHFSSAGKICGAKVQTFLLEKSRVVKRTNGERSYHIFYQLCAGAPPSMREKLNLKMAKDYHYLKQSDCLTIEGVNDTRRFNELMEAMDIVQIRKEDQENVFEILAAVLWLGNISFLVSESECHVEVVQDEGVISASKLLGCNIQDLILALSTRNIQAGKDNIVQKLTLAQAVDTRDALAKSIYSSLFEWLVEQINKSLGVGKMSTGRSISILDIYGFESFHKNSFEQFCINYANERLQQHFNRHLFKLEQEDYIQDGIDWTKVDFIDNAECLNLFEKRPLGLFSLLDEESTFPKATDLTFANKLKQHLKSNPFFKDERGCAFRVCHYAGEVLYHTGGFLEKNRDLLHYDSLQLLLSSKHNLPKSFASNMLDKSQDPGSPLRPWNSAADTLKQSVGTKFKSQLFKLMQRMEKTTPHFIRCIKPNGGQLPNVFEHDLVLQQLRCCGVLEVVRISRSGYPTRLTHQQFAERFGFLLSENVVSQDPLSVSVAILQQFNVLPDMYQVGYTKLFLRTGQIAALEDNRNRTLRGVVGVQKCFRGLQARRHFQQLRRGITLLQSFIRGERSRNDFRLKREKWKAVLILQKNVKRRMAWKLHNDRRNASLVLQSVIRGYTARKQFAFLQDLEKMKPNQTSSCNKQDNIVPVVQEQDSHTDRPQVDHSVMAELHRRVLKAEAVARQKEVENKSLLQELKQYEARWTEYENKMKSMEETWQKQLTALQASLAAARKSLNSEDAATQLGKIDDNSPTDLYYDSEDMLSLGNLTPEVPSTTRPPCTSDGALGRASGGGHHTMNHLIKEFEQQKQVFEDDARFLVEVKSSRSGSDMNIDEEFRKLKVRFASWKKDYKVRLRGTKTALQKLGYLEAEKSKRRWWGKRNTKGA